MMKVLALFVVIAIVVCKGEAGTDGKWKLKKGSPRIVEIEESTMKDPALEQEILNALILGISESSKEKDIAPYVIDHIKSFGVSVVCLVIPTEKDDDPKDFAYASSTNEFVKIVSRSKPKVSIYVFKV